MPTFELTRGSETYEVEATDAETAVKALDTQLGTGKIGTTVDDVGTGIKSGITTGAIGFAPAIPAFAADVGMLPAHIATAGADFVTSYLPEGYQTNLHEPLVETFGGPFSATGKVGEWAAKQADKLVDAPVSSGGKVTRELTSAGIEALAGSGLFKVLGLAGKFFTSYDDAVKAAGTIAAPSRAQKIVQAVDPREAPVAQAAYSAAAGGGGEIAQQNDVNPLIGTGLGLAAAAGGHAALRAVPAGVRAIGENIDETLTRTPEIRDRKTAAALREAARDPEALDEWARSGATGELVPGSQPTLYEAAGEDRGIGAAQRKQRMENPVYKIEEEEQRAAQNVARVEELKRLGGEGTPAEILTEFRRLRDEIDTTTAAYERQAQEGAAAKAQRAGTLETPEAIGEAVRGPVVAAQNAAKAAGDELYAKIGAEGVTVGTGRLKAAIAQFYKDIPEKPLSPEERRIAGLVKGYGGRNDFNTLKALRETLTAQAADQGLNLVERRRAKMLRNAIDVAMDDGLAKAIADDPKLMQRVVAGVEPPVDRAATERFRTAQRHWAENVKQPYEAKPVGAIVKDARTPSRFEMTTGGVAQSAFLSDNKGAEAIRALKRAGASEAALTEAAALSFSDPKRGVIRDGVVDPKGFRRWVNNYGPALDELPPAVRQRFASANDAAETLRVVSEARKAALRDFDESAVGKALGIPAENLQKAIGAYLENPAATTQLARQVADNPAAKAGLQRLVAEHILGRFTNASDDLSKNALTTWIHRNKPQLATIFGNDNARRFEQLVDDIERSRRLLTVGKDPAGPGTAGDIAAMGSRAMGATVMSLIGKAFGPKGMAVAGAAKIIVANLKTAGIQSVDEVLARALLDPELARKLLTKAPAVKNEKFLKGLGSTILRSSLAGAAYGGQQ